MTATETPRAKPLLLALAARLRKMHEKPETVGFNYTQWWDSWPGCGTVACAAGHAALMPEFQELGLWIDAIAGAGEVVCRDALGGRAMALVLDISDDDAEYLFIPDEMPPMGTSLPRSPRHEASALDVAEHIERYMAARWPEATP